jgi:hypothetical protein
LVDELAGRGVELQDTALAQLGAQASKRPVGAGPAPAGSAKASPLSRFTLSSMLGLRGEGDGGK